MAPASYQMQVDASDQFDGTFARTFSVLNATGGTYRFHYNSLVTAPIPFDATAAEVKAALNAIAGDTSVTFTEVYDIGGGQMTLVAPSGMKRFVIDGADLTPTPAPTVQLAHWNPVYWDMLILGASGGYGELYNDGSGTAEIPFNASAAAVLAELQSCGLSATNVYGTAANDDTSTLILEFSVAPAFLIAGASFLT